MRRVVKVSFGRWEADLYEWLLSKAKETGKGRRWGVSEYIKSLLRAARMAESMNTLSVVDIYREEISSFRCPVCGAKPRLIGVKSEEDSLCLKYWCENCGMGRTKTITREEFAAAFGAVKALSLKAIETVGEREKSLCKALESLGGDLGKAIKEGKVKLL